eukprot:TRINITY_DN790_c0_g1_i7.p2 TRINITY_DN790_c0_g1~~TRINITY_DN790_c0_g1_i7.p2  ORF type:complete len:153 (-),score=33.80 TRINITY_DN790_c0_g1_i7:160-618(-)
MYLMFVPCTVLIARSLSPSLSLSLSVDMWSVGCIFAEMCNLEAIFRADDRPNQPVQGPQLAAIFDRLGVPDEKCKLRKLEAFDEVLKEYRARPANANRKGRTPLPKLPGIYKDTHLYDLLSKMLEYDPDKRITAEEALKHDWFKQGPLPAKK